MIPWAVCSNTVNVPAKYIRFCYLFILYAFGCVCRWGKMVYTTMLMMVLISHLIPCNALTIVVNWKLYYFLLRKTFSNMSFLSYSYCHLRFRLKNIVILFHYYFFAFFFLYLSFWIARGHKKKKTNKKKIVKEDNFASFI